MTGHPRIYGANDPWRRLESTARWDTGWAVVEAARATNCLNERYVPGTAAPLEPVHEEIVDFGGHTFDLPPQELVVAPGPRARVSCRGRQSCRSPGAVRDGAGGLRRAVAGTKARLRSCP